MQRLVLLVLLPTLHAAQRHWLGYHSGPFELYTDSGAKRGREILGWFDQFKYVLGYMLGNQDLQTARPLRILLFKTNNQRVDYPFSPAIIAGRDRWHLLLSAASPIPTEVCRECAPLFLENNARRRPPAIRPRLPDGM